MVDTCKLRLNGIENFNPSGDSFDVKLKNGAECNFDGNDLKCRYNAKSHNPFSQPVHNPDTDYRFTEQIKIGNIQFDSSKSTIDNEINKLFSFKVNDDTEGNYVAEYPVYSDLDMERNINIASKDGKSIVNIKGFSGYNEENSNIYFADIDKGGTRVIVQYKEDSLVVENKRLDNLGSKLEIESIDQTSREIDLESKSGTLEYDDTYQVRYYTEPDDNYHNLEINII